MEELLWMIFKEKRFFKRSSILKQQKSKTEEGKILNQYIFF
jgi:hypothetical protein